MVGENAAPLDGWVMPARHCGSWCDTNVCPVCLNYIPPVDALNVMSELDGIGDN